MYRCIGVSVYRCYYMLVVCEISLPSGLYGFLFICSFVRFGLQFRLAACKAVYWPALVPVLVRLAALAATHWQGPRQGWDWKAGKKRNVREEGRERKKKKFFFCSFFLFLFFLCESLLFFWAEDLLHNVPRKEREKKRIPDGPRGETTQVLRLSMYLITRGVKRKRVGIIFFFPPHDGRGF